MSDALLQTETDVHLDDSARQSAADVNIVDQLERSQHASGSARLAKFTGHSASGTAPRQSHTVSLSQKDSAGQEHAASEGQAHQEQASASHEQAAGLQASGAEHNNDQGVHAGAASEEAHAGQATESGSHHENQASHTSAGGQEQQHHEQGGALEGSAVLEGGTHTAAPAGPATHTGALDAATEVENEKEREAEFEYEQEKMKEYVAEKKHVKQQHEQAHDVQELEKMEKNAQKQVAAIEEQYAHEEPQVVQGAVGAGNTEDQVSKLEDSIQSAAIDAAVKSIQDGKKVSASPDSGSHSKTEEVDDQMKAYVVKAKVIKKEEKEKGPGHAEGEYAAKIKQAINKDDVVKKAVQSGIAEEKLHSDLIKQHDAAKKHHRHSSERKAALRYLEDEVHHSKYNEKDLEQVVHMADKMESNVHPYEIIAANNHRIKHNKRPTAWSSIKSVLKLGQSEQTEYARQVSANRDLKAALQRGEESRRAAESEEIPKAEIDQSQKAVERALRAEIEDTPAPPPEPMGPEPRAAAKVVESAPHKGADKEMTERGTLAKLMDEVDDDINDQVHLPPKEVQAQTQEVVDQEIPLVEEFASDVANEDTDAKIKSLANSIKLDDGDAPVNNLLAREVQTQDGPEEDDLLELSAETAAASQAQMRAMLQLQAFAKAKALTKSTAKAQTRVRAQDNNLIAALQKQIAVMEAKNNPVRAAEAAKKKAVHNIQKALTNKILNRLDDSQPLVNVFSKMQSLSKMMPAVQDFERRLNILQQVEPIIQNAVSTLQKVIDLRNSPLQPAQAPPPPPPAPEPALNDFSLESLTAAAATPAAPAGGPDLSQLQALLGAAQAGAQQQAAPEEAPAAGGGLDLSALGLGGLGGMASAFGAPAPAEEDQGLAGGQESALLAKLMGKM